MGNYESVLEFKKYIVNNVEFKSNLNFAPIENLKLNFSIKKEVTYENNNMYVKLFTNIFENSKENNYPFEMSVELMGIFEIKGDSKINWEANAIAILYPYIRSIVSTYSTASNVYPVILPVINVNAMLKENK